MKEEKVENNEDKVKTRRKEKTMREGERKKGFDGSIERRVETLNGDNEKNKINRWEKRMR